MELYGDKGPKAGIERRLRYWLGGDCAGLATYNETMIKNLASAFLPGLVAGLLRFVVNGANASTRYANTSSAGLILDCPWCGGLGGDDIAHLSSCLAFWVQVSQQWPKVRRPSTRNQAIQFFSLADLPSIGDAAVRMFVADLVMKSYQSRRSQLAIGAAANRFIKQAITARRRHWVRGDKKGSFKKLLRDMQ